MNKVTRRPPIDAPYLRILRKAVQIAGDEANLARTLQVPLEHLNTWLAGEMVPPVDFYIAALGMVEREGEKWKAAGSASPRCT